MLEAAAPTVYPEPVRGVCVNHPDATAETLCDVCGDLLCGRCALPQRTMLLCPQCGDRWEVGHAVLVEAEQEPGGGRPVLLGVGSLMLVLGILWAPTGSAPAAAAAPPASGAAKAAATAAATAATGWLIWLSTVGCYGLALAALADARAHLRRVDASEAGEAGRMMARIAAVLAVLALTSSSLCLVLRQVLD